MCTIPSLIIPNNFPPSAKIWIFQSISPFQEDLKHNIFQKIQEFLAHWTTHGNFVNGWGNLFLDRFILILADESSITVSGCSRDSLMHFIQELEIRFQFSLLDHQILSFWIENKVLSLHKTNLKDSFDNGIINEETFYFNTVAQSKKEWEENGLLQIKDSWMISKIKGGIFSLPK